MHIETTCARMEPCIIGNAEEHNFREKECPYVRKALSCENIYERGISSKDRLEKIKKEYKRAVGQKKQPSAHPIQEIVVTGITKREEALAFVDSVTKNLGVEVLSWAIHKDEGHSDSSTNIWIPNYHAHFIVDTTIWTHEQIRCIKKSHGKPVKDEKGAVVFELKDQYARRRHFGRREMALLQDFASQATGLKRGESSDREHYSVARMRMVKLQDDIRILMGQEQDIKKSIGNIQHSLERSCEDILDFGYRIIETCENEVRDIERTVPMELSLDNYDIAIKKLKIDLKEQEGVCYGTEQITDNLSQVLELIHILIDILARAIDKLKKEIQRLWAESRQVSTMEETKGFIKAVIGKPATMQAKQLTARVKELESAVKNQERTIEELKMENQNLFEENATLSSWKQENEFGAKRYSELLTETNNRARDLDYQLWFFAKSLNREELRVLEYKGLKSVLGDSGWSTLLHHFDNAHRDRGWGQNQKLFLSNK